jgi:N-methylhydantoinase A
MLLADVRREQVRTIHALLSDLDAAEFADRCRELADELVDQIRSGAVACSTITIVAGVDLRYRGQTYELTVPVAAPDFRISGLDQAFHRAHLNRYGHFFEGHEVELLNLRMAAVGHLETKVDSDPSWPDFPETSRPVFWGPEVGWQETPVVSRAAVTRREGIEGPAIIEPTDTTIVVPPGARATVAGFGCLVLTRESSA